MKSATTAYCQNNNEGSTDFVQVLEQKKNKGNTTSGSQVSLKAFTTFGERVAYATTRESYRYTK